MPWYHHYFDTSRVLMRLHIYQITITRGHSTNVMALCARIYLR